MTRSVVLVLTFLLVGCGDDGSGVAPDAPTPDASIDASIDAAIDAPVRPAQIASFLAVSPVISVGQSTALIATYTGASATIDGGVGAVDSGMGVAVAPTSETTYTLTVIGDDGSTETATVTVRPFAAVTFVTTTADSGEGSLRAVLDGVQGTNAQIAIAFAVPLPATIELASSLKTTTGNLIVIGPGADSLTISGGALHRPWFVGGGTLALDGVTIANGLGKGGNGGRGTSGGGGGGAAGMGGAMFIQQGAVTLRDVVFAGNTAQGGAGGGTNGTGLSNGGGGGGFGGDGGNGSTTALSTGGTGGGGGDLGGAGGNENGTAGGDGGGGGGGGAAEVENGGAGGFAGGGGGGGGLNGGGNGGFGGGAGGGSSSSPGTFGGNRASNTGGGGAGLGGAIFLRAGTLTIDGATFTDSQALAGAGGGAGAGTGSAKGGAIFALVPDVTLTDVTYTGSVAADAGTTATDNADVYITQP